MTNPEATIRDKEPKGDRLQTESIEKRNLDYIERLGFKPDEQDDSPDKTEQKTVKEEDEGDDRAKKV